MTLEALLILIFAAAVIAGVVLSVARVRTSLEDATAALVKTHQDCEPAERDVERVRQLQRDLARVSGEKEEWRSELRQARAALIEANSALKRGEAERAVLLLRLEPAQEIIREAAAIRAMLESERVAHARELLERQAAAEHEILEIQRYADALRREHEVALQHYQSLRRAIGTVQSRLAEQRTPADLPEPRPVPPPSSGTQPLRGPEVRTNGPRPPLS